MPSEAEIEAAAKAICVARDGDPMTLHQFNIFTGKEPFDHEDDRGRRYTYAWRARVDEARAALTAASAVRSEPAGYLVKRATGDGTQWLYEFTRDRGAPHWANLAGEPENCVPLYTSPVQTREDRLEKSLRSIAEGNLGDAPWQANYDKIRAVAREALSQPEPKGDNRYTPEANAAIEQLQAAGFDYAEADMIYHGDMLGSALGAKTATLITSLREARAEIAALVPADRDPMDDTDNQVGFRNAIYHVLQIIDAALNPSRKETGHG